MKIPHAFSAFLASALALLLAAPTASVAECVAACPSEYLPVCGNNSALYSNQCFLDYDACMRPKVVSPVATGTLDCETPPNPTPGEEPIGGTAALDDPSTDWVWPTVNEPSEGFEGSSSTSSSGDSDSDSDSGSDKDDNPLYVLPTNVVIDDNAPSASDFVPGGKGGDGSDEGIIGGTTDVDTWGFFESAELESGDGSSASSSSGDGDGGSGDSDGRECEKACLDRYEPVCATNNVTYSSRCNLALAQCLDASVEPAHMGECGSTPASDPCAFNCLMWDLPVCSADGYIYSNECTYGSALCRDPTLGEATAEMCKSEQ